MAASNPLTASEQGRHRRTNRAAGASRRRITRPVFPRPRDRRLWTAVSATVLVASVTLGVSTWSGGFGPLAGDGCSYPRTLRVAAAPEVAPAVAVAASAVAGL